MRCVNMRLFLCFTPPPPPTSPHPLSLAYLTFQSGSAAWALHQGAWRVGPPSFRYVSPTGNWFTNFNMPTVGGGGWYERNSYVIYSIGDNIRWHTNHYLLSIVSVLVYTAYYFGFLIFTSQGCWGQAKGFESTSRSNETHGGVGEVVFLLVVYFLTMVLYTCIIVSIFLSVLHQTPRVEGKSGIWNLEFFCNLEMGFFFWILYNCLENIVGGIWNSDKTPVSPNILVKYGFNSFWKLPCLLPLLNVLACFAAAIV